MIKKKGLINTSKKYFKKFYLNKSFLKRNLSNILKYKFLSLMFLNKKKSFFLKSFFKKNIQNTNKKNLIKSILFLVKNYFYCKKTLKVKLYAI